MVDLGERRHRALAPAAAGALLDRHRRRNAEDRVHVRPRGRLHELPRVGVQRFQIAALAFGEQDVEGERALAAAADAGDDGESSRGMSTSMFLRLCSRALRMRIDARRRVDGERRQRTASGARSCTAGASCAYVAQRRAGVAALAWPSTCAGVPAHTTSPPASPPSGPRSMIQSAARITSRLCSMTSSEWPASSSRAKAPQQGARCRRSAGPWSARRTGTACALSRLPLARCRRDGRRASGAAPRRRTASAPAGPGAGSRARRRPAAPAPREHVGVLGEKLAGLGHRHVQHVGDGLRVAIGAGTADLQHLRPVAAAVAVRAAQVHVARGTASPRARSRCRRRSGSGRCRR